MEYGFYTSLPDYNKLLWNKENYYPTIPIEYQGYVSCEELLLYKVYVLTAKYSHKRYKSWFDK